jgi:hypothetical protein
LNFIGFSNPDFWQLERLLGKDPTLMERAKGLSDRASYRLIELLDPEVTHYEFFLGRSPLPKADWSSDAALLAAISERHPCIDGWPSRCLFNYDYQIVNLLEPEFEFLQACDTHSTVGEILTKVQMGLDGVRSLLSQQLILLASS